MRVRLIACRCTAGGTNPDYAHSSGVQLQGFKLMFCTHGLVARVDLGSNRQGEVGRSEGADICK